MNFNTPILLIIFNRPECAKRALLAIKKMLPTKLYIAADGPRPDNASDLEKCIETRKVTDLINWPCEVKTFFRDENLGCGKGPSFAISWLFENEESGIILEDDCIPDPTFFLFCRDLLAKYQDDSQVMHISGTNHNPSFVRNEDYSYYFSKVGHSWGWASWRRAWNHFDYSMKNLDEILEKKYFNDLFPNYLVRKYFKRKFTQTFNNEIIGVWDYQWEFSRLINSGLSITPTKNLIRNIGFGEDATHTFSEVNTIADVVVEKMEFPLKHPPFIIKDGVAENRYFSWLFTGILKRKLLSIFRIKGYKFSG